VIEEKDLDQAHEEEELFEHYRFTADPGQELLRIDKFLIDRLPNTSRNKIQVAAKNGNVLVNNQIVKQNYRVKPADIVSIVMPYPIREIELIAQDIPINIVYEDDELILVNKTVDMVVHPAYGHYSGTLVNALIYHFKHLPSLPKNYYGRPGLVHRIDKNTSGILLVAKTEDALTHLAKQFYEKTTERTYWALVWGDVKDDGTITGNVGRSLKNRKVMAVFKDGELGKHAVTHYRVLERFGFGTLVECKLETGRTHQIRVHMQFLGHPLFNDPEYGGNKILRNAHKKEFKLFIEKCFALLPGQALHAKTLGFVHPKTKENISFSSPLNEGMQTLLESWQQFRLEN
jgi:23S rRNA pseudouridine1911/1915/1917 synthase